jgi:iron-sulfur cluster repair protein YtfE (RIC family)
MCEVGCTADAVRTNAGPARYGILAQHRQLRRLLDSAQALAEAALDGKAAAGPEVVAAAIGELRSVMEIHLAFEENILLPLLNADPTEGAARAGRLLDEHARQRDMLAVLHAEACAHPELPMVAAKLAGLTKWLRADMEEEERSLLGGNA